MNAATMEDFLKEMDLNEKHTDIEVNKACTRELLKEGDRLLSSSVIINDMIKNNSFQQMISGDTYIEETVDGKPIQRPVVDLVQQGGTMLGIGLLGYTYVMERAGVRFYSMAGTSAGAINTLLLSALPEKIYLEKSLFDPSRMAVKSELLAYVVANKDFSEFLDRPGKLGQVQLWLVKRINKIRFIMPFIKLLSVLILIGLSFGMYYLLDHFIFNSDNGLTQNEINNYNFIIGTLGTFAILLLAIIVALNLFKKNMGFNPGDAPYEWMKSILASSYVGITTTADLLTRKRTEKKPMILAGNTRVALATDPRLVFISANLTHNRIVKFPDNSADYWDKNDAPFVCPAAYVRASMSLPFIFHAFIPDDKHVIRNNPVDTVSLLARFVDGGMLSNFPIREFHVPPPQKPTHPTFGVLLGSPKPEPIKNSRTSLQKFWSLSVFKYILSFISTFRNFYDSDFLRSHPEFSRLVKAVNTDEFNSLDFGMNFSTKKKIFSAGAKTAIEQLEQFNWEKYLSVRMGTPSISTI